MREAIQYKEFLEKKIKEISMSLPHTNSLGLYNGEMGKVVLYGYLSLHYDNPDYLEKMEDCIRRVFIKAKNSVSGNTFCSGLSGILWVLHHFKSKGLVDFEDDLTGLHNELKGSATAYAEKGNFDFLHGSSGIIYYLLETNNLDAGTLDEWLSCLKKSAIIDGNKIYWETTLAPEGGKKVYNLSLSHGMSSVIILLSEISARFPSNRNALSMLKGSIEYMLSCQNKDVSNYYFPNYIFANKIDGKSQGGRLAWCYGDLGNAVALWRAGKLADNIVWKTKAINILLAASQKRDLPENGIVDACFCHGTSGIAHIFNRFFHETGITEFEIASKYWIHITLNLAKWSDGLAGYKMFSSKEKHFTKEYTLLEGTAGIGLVLLASLAKDHTSFEWDRCLMLS